MYRHKFTGTIFTGLKKNYGPIGVYYLKDTVKITDTLSCDIAICAHENIERIKPRQLKLFR